MDKFKHHKTISLKSRLLVFIICLVCLSTQIAHAQIYTKGDINIGIEGGIQFTNTSDSYVINVPESGIGYTIGPFFDYHFSPGFKVRLALIYDNRAFGLHEPPYAITDTSGTLENSYLQVTRDYTVNYATIPISIFYVKGSDKFKMYLQLSFYYSIYLNANQTGTNDLYIAPEDYQNVSDSTLVAGHNITTVDGPVEQGFNSSDFGINFYLGGIIKLTPNLGLSISPGFTVGMSNVYEDPNRDSRWSRIFKINAGIIYTLKKK